MPNDMSDGGGDGASNSVTNTTPTPDRQTRWLYLVVAVSAMGYGAVITLLAELRDEYGFSGLGIGSLGAAEFTAAFFSHLYFSKFADRGHTSLLIRLGLAVDLAALAWMAATNNVWQFVAARVLLGLGSGLYYPAAIKILISKDPANVGHNMGKTSAYDTAGFALGPLLAAVIAEFAGLRWPFAVMAGIYAVLLAAIWRQDLHHPAAELDTETDTDEEIGAEIEGETNAETNAETDAETNAEPPLPTKLTSKQIINQLLVIPGIKGALLATIAFAIAYGTLEVSWALLLTDNGASTWLIGVSLAVLTLPMIYFAPKGGRLAQRRGPLKMVIWAQLISVIFILAYGWFDLLWIILAISLIHTLADSVTDPGLQVAVSQHSPKAHIAAGQGLMNSTGLAVAALASLLAGPIYERGGAELLYSLTAGLIMAVLLLASRYRETAPVK